MPLLAEGDVTVHKLLEGVSPDEEAPAYESVILTYGDALEEKEVPKYVLERVKAGETALLKVVSRSQVEKIQAEVAEKKARELENVQEVNASNADEDRETT